MKCLPPLLRRKNPIRLSVVFRLALIDLIKISFSNPSGNPHTGAVTNRQRRQGEAWRVQQAEVQLELLSLHDSDGPESWHVRRGSSSTPSGTTTDTYDGSLGLIWLFFLFFLIKKPPKNVAVKRPRTGFV